MRTASIAVNAVIFVVTLVLVGRCFRKDGRWAPSRGLAAFRYFTVLSNVLSALAALAMICFQLSGDVPAAILTLKYLGTASVTVTLMTVLLFLGPTQGYGTMLSGINLYMHLVGPLLAIVSFCALEKREMALSTALLGLLPVLLYGALYLYRVLYAPKDRRWEDFYGFNAGGRWPVSFGLMLLGTLAVCVALWLL